MADGVVEGQASAEACQAITSRRLISYDSAPMQAQKTPMQYRLRALLLCLVLANPSAAATTGEVPIGAQLPDAALQGLNGPPRHLSSFRGRPLLINVWASWCGPCKQEMASLERLAWQEQDFAIIGISTDDYADEAASLLKGTHATISHFIDHDLQMENMLGASHLPLTVLVDADGRVLEKIYGARQWDGADSLRLINDTFHKALRPR
jgi:thiol-disulfide isomerase/thioredoxin